VHARRRQAFHEFRGPPQTSSAPRRSKLNCQEEQVMAVGITIVVLVGIRRIRSQDGLQPSSARAMFA